VGSIAARHAIVRQGSHVNTGAGPKDAGSPAAPAHETFFMRALIAAIMSVLISSCATEGGYNSTLLRWEKLHNQPGFETYVTAFIGAQNAAHLDANSGCYNFNVGTTLDLLLVVESSGRISAAYTDMESKKAKCFRKAYAGVKMPIPPFSPFPMRIRVR
jgi:hypothetical protein